MKFILTALLMISTAYAGENCTTRSDEGTVQETTVITTDVPAHLKGATIVVRLANGKESSVPAEQFKVVPRVQQRLITKVQTKELTVCKEILDNKNRVSLLGGQGLTGSLDKNIGLAGASVKSNTGLVGGLQYQRSITDRISVGVQSQTNKTNSLMIGVDF